MENADLARILGNARKVMNKVESGDFSKGFVNESSIVDSTTCLNTLPPGQMPTGNAAKYMAEPEGVPGIAGKNLPANIRKLMEERPIEVPNPLTKGGFSLDDVASLVVKRPEAPVNENYMSGPSHLSQPSHVQHQQYEAPKRVQNMPINEIKGDSDMIVVSKSELKNMINECLLSFMTNFATNIKETTIKDVIKLIKEGKINATKKQ